MPGDDASFPLVCVHLAIRRKWFLCANAGGRCEPDEEFTDYYGKPVYLCEV